MASHPAQNHTGQYAPKLAHCKRCGSDNVIWHKSQKTDKFYLCNWSGVGSPDSGFYYQPFDFHKCGSAAHA